jgi:hypothetical protein
MTDAKDSSSAEKKIHASPTKDFFVNMITRDITLQDCIFDLLDNSIDGARRSAETGKRDYLAGKWANISLSRERFVIDDNCGGIRLTDAVDYAFHFGRQIDSPADVKGGIGLYGIGMKRAIFKMGRKAEVSSETTNDAFRVIVDVDEWVRNEKDWDFDYVDEPRRGTNGTSVRVEAIYPEVAVALGDESFKNQLIKAIASDYSFYISRGFEIKVGDIRVPSFKYTLKSSKDFAPAVESYTDDGVNVRIAVGFIDELPDDVPEEVRPEDVERFGWYVVCNDRIVLNADKTDRSVWGDDQYRTWHPQYNGFAGFVFFTADDQRKLPWTTTKRDLDQTSAIYRRAIVRMKSLTDTFVRYTYARKSALEEAKEVESKAGYSEVYVLTAPRTASFPSFTRVLKPDVVNISYQKPRKEVERVRKHLGRSAMTLKEIGTLTFDYYISSEIGE